MASHSLSFHRCSPILIPLPILDKKDDTFGALQYKCALKGITKWDLDD